MDDQHLRPRLPDELPAKAAAEVSRFKCADWRTLRIASYNPLNLNSPLRIEDISNELKNHDMVGIIGTGCRQRYGEKGATLRGAYFHFGVAADWDRAPFTNKACGVQLLLRKKTFSPKMIRATYLPPASCTGRALGVEIVQGQVHFLAILLYLPPKASGKAISKYIKTINTLLKWAGNLLAQVACRATPILFMDANLQVGLQQVGAHWVPNPSRTIGASNPGKEFQPATALFTDFLEIHDIALVNTFQDSGDTYVGANSRSRIDYVGLPAGMLGNVQSCGVLTKASARLQIINVRGLRDHLILQCVFWYQVCNKSEDLQAPRWHTETLTRMASTGLGKAALVEEIEEISSEKEINGT
jgi:hypothetical protein